MECSHLTAGARDSERLVLVDRDRADLLDRVTASVGAPSLLAYCLLDTHVHLVVEGPGERARAAVGRALNGYVQSFNTRHRRSGGLLRGPVSASISRNPRELARQIAYVHANPSSVKPPIAIDPLLFAWSSARAFVGLSRAPVPNVARAVELLGPERHRVAERQAKLADLAPSLAPVAAVPVLLVAAAEAFAVAVDDLVGPGRTPLLVAARAVYIALGRLEGYRDAQLAAPLGRERRQVSNLGALPADRHGVRIARTLLRWVPVRVRLQEVAARCVRERAPPEVPAPVGR